MSALDDLLRFRFLETVYDTTHGNRFQDTNIDVIAPAVGLSNEAADQIAPIPRRRGTSLMARLWRRHRDHAPRSKGSRAGPQGTVEADPALPPRQLHH
jgi:hypothetical protein